MIDFCMHLILLFLTESSDVEILSVEVLSVEILSSVEILFVVSFPGSSGILIVGGC